TVTEVRMTRDLRVARVYWCTREGGDMVEEAAGAFARAKGYIRRELAKTLELRYMPDLEFFYDQAIDQGDHIHRLLKKVADESPPNPDPDKQEE
ncbi:MAG: 30S ribosome-binding factor RbfA, partial [Proteobacteria bacterium]|nr:30S ribosome-binding factor RbfA [Pseudomonadota bacterium]